MFTETRTDFYSISVIHVIDAFILLRQDFIVLLDKSFPIHDEDPDIYGVQLERFLDERNLHEWFHRRAVRYQFALEEPGIYGLNMMILYFL